MMSEETFGQALRRLRGSRSLRDLAQRATCGKSYVADLETGRRRPTEAIAAALDTALDAHGALIALAGVRADMPVLAQAAALQLGLSDALAAGPMTDASLNEWDYTVARHGRATRFRPEGELLPELLSDFADLKRLLGHRHSVHVRRRLTLAVAHMSGLMALTLLKLGDASSRDWWRTGRAAAAAAEDREVLSWMYAQEAYQQYYSGDVEGAVELACRAQHLAGGLPCVGPALAAPLEARAHALLGRREEAVAALAAADTALGRLDPADRIGSAFGYSESQFRFHSGNAWTHLRETARAGEQQARALELYPLGDHTDRALIHLDQAVCLAADGDPAGAAVLATDTIVTLPADHRSALIIYRARELATSVPEAQEVRALREVLALPPGERDS
ncbi:helix-turn-helix domain-containing protein [Streptomyces sp. H39-C1]|uniref:helix-turn-helix domain-containing protein n=1 Tax=Streptomyces sp. H39-C1 TaxID=3004355 RepID=UPI0022AEC44F|nr:helix-turn-helix domain-containing protein [Streptomyces sp. H39-C1]MCZ4096648.1 helix-turn-helix domain-containing protein [Streptomyces sp. H39-C1]